MKKIFASILLLSFALQSMAQKVDYILKSDIRYYSEVINKTDAYINERCILDIYYPKNAKGFATIIYFHGGGLTSGNKFIPERLTKQGYAVIAVNYRLSPKVNAIKCIEDAAAATAWVFKNIADFDGDPNQIFVTGHSAGAYLALMIGLDKKWLNVQNVDANTIAGIIPMSGQCITHFLLRAEKGIPETQPIIDEFAPLYHVRSDAPPLLLITGDRELEMLGRYEENAYLMRMMKIIGHKQTLLLELEGYGHNMEEPAYPLLLNEVKRILKERKK